MTWTGATNSPALALAASLQYSGNLTFIAAMTVSQTSGYLITYASGKTITTNGCVLACTNRFGNGSSYTLQDAYDGTGGTLVFANTTSALNTNNQTVTVTQISDIGQAGTHTLTLGSSTINVGTWEFTGDTPAITANTATINVSGNKFYGGGAQTYNIVNINGAACTITGSNKYASLVFKADTTQTITLTAGTTQTITTPVLTGSVGKVKTIISSSAGTSATLAKTSAGKVTCAYMSLKDNIGYPNFTWYSTYSTKVSNIKGWDMSGNIAKLIAGGLL